MKDSEAAATEEQLQAAVERGLEDERAGRVAPLDMERIKAKARRERSRRQDAEPGR